MSLHMNGYMQTIHFSQGKIVEYRDNYYNVPKTAYIIGSKCRYEGYVAPSTACIGFAITAHPTLALCAI